LLDGLLTVCPETASAATAPVATTVVDAELEYLIRVIIG